MTKQITTIGFFLIFAALAFGADVVRVEPGTMLQAGYDESTCWFQARAAASPTGEAVLATQKYLLNSNDVYYDIHSSYSEDNGKTWSELVPQDGFGRIRYKPGTDEAMEAVCCDEVPAYHAQSGKFLMTGCMAFYRDNQNTSEARFPLCENLPEDAAETDTWYSVFDRETKTWSPPEILTVPAGSAAVRGRAGCTQRLDLPDGTILLPVYVPNPNGCYHTVVLHCDFDGKHLRCLEEGKPLILQQPRGFCEPSITAYKGRYYLTLRNDEMGYITASDDGLNFDDPIPWRWQSEEDGGEPGEIIGSYNTQQHWLRLGEKLYLVYTRRGANNDHIFRHRAPLFIAEFDPRTMTLLRPTEQVAVPEHGVALGNFGTTEVSDREGWVVVSERMPSKIKEQSNYKQALARGASGAIWISRIFAEETK